MSEIMREPSVSSTTPFPLNPKGRADVHGEDSRAELFFGGVLMARESRDPGGQSRTP